MHKVMTSHETLTWSCVCLLFKEAGTSHSVPHLCFAVVIRSVMVNCWIKTATSFYYHVYLRRPRRTQGQVFPMIPW